MSNFLIDEETDLLAAEFVLGTLDSEERANAQAQLRKDHGFIAMVRIWERRFGELHLMVEPVEPDAKIFQRIKAKIAEIAPREPVPEGKPPLATAPTPESPAAPGAPTAAEMPSPADVETADAGTSAETASAEMASAATASETAPSQELSANGTPPKTAEPPATGETPVPSNAPAVEEQAAATAAGPEPRPVETAENGAAAQASAALPTPVTPLPLVEAAEQRPELKVADQPPDRRQEPPLRLVRSRRRWRALGLAMTLLVLAVAAILAAWRFAPDRLPGGLQAAQVMMSLGIEPASRPAPRLKQAPPPESQFDE
jgi:hypothetical protein